MRLIDLQQRKVGVLGFGREGQAVCQSIQQRAPECDVTVLCETALPADQQSSYPVVIGEFAASALSQFDILIKSPGISLYHPAIQAALAAGSQLTSGTNLWFAENPDARVVAITGTKGKSTTAALTAHLLVAAGLTVQLAGNIGVPLISRLDCKADVWVLELSSFQIADLQAQPELAILVSLFAEHIDWHHGPQQYFTDKLRLLSLAKNICIEHHLLSQLKAKPEWQDMLPDKPLLAYNDHTGWHPDDDHMMYADQQYLPLDQIPLRGRHNHINASAALTVCDWFNVEQVVAIQALRTFQALPHRLETVAELNGVLYVNDSIATTPMAVVKALEAFVDRKVVLIVGGYDQGAKWQPLVDAVYESLSSSLKAVLGLPDNGADLINELYSAFSDQATPFSMNKVIDIDAAIEQANQWVQPGDVGLLSPGAPSYCQYNNFEDRGNDFRRLVQSN